MKTTAMESQRKEEEEGEKSGTSLLCLLFDLDGGLFCSIQASHLWMRSHGKLSGDAGSTA